MLDVSIDAAGGFAHALLLAFCSVDNIPKKKVYTYLYTHVVIYSDFQRDLMSCRNLFRLYLPSVMYDWLGCCIELALTVKGHYQTSHPVFR